MSEFYSGPRTVGGIATFNIQDSFVEALARGYRSGFLNDTDYHHLTQCETLDDVKLNLAETDYGTFLQNEPGPLVVSTIRDKCYEKLVAEFEYLRANATQPLARFLDCVTYEYMIENIMLVLKATLNNPNVDVAELLEQSHPMGRFDESTMRSICAFENTPKGYADLYQTVLIDTPIGPYFSQFLKEESERGRGQAGEAVRALVEEMPTTKLENTLRKLHLEDFYFFCQELGGDTATEMGGLLKARADAMAINITLNSFGTSLNEPNMRQSDRKLLYPSIGHLYPEGTERLCFVGDEDELGNAVAPYKDYREIWDAYQTGETTIDDAFYQRDVRLGELAFEGQMSYACFYAYVKLKEQEIRNIVWICECIVQRQRNKIVQHSIPIFSENSPWRKR